MEASMIQKGANFNQNTFCIVFWKDCGNAQPRGAQKTVILTMTVHVRHVHTHSIIGDISHEEYQSILANRYKLTNIIRG